MRIPGPGFWQRNGFRVGVSSPLLLMRVRCEDGSSGPVQNSKPQHRNQRNLRRSRRWSRPCMSSRPCWMNADWLVLVGRLRHVHWFPQRICFEWRAAIRSSILNQEFRRYWFPITCLEVSCVLSFRHLTIWTLASFGSGNRTTRKSLPSVLVRRRPLSLGRMYKNWWITPVVGRNQNSHSFDGHGVCFVAAGCMRTSRNA